jgi:hypothetical protein
MIPDYKSGGKGVPVPSPQAGSSTLVRIRLPMTKRMRILRTP